MEHKITVLLKSTLHFGETDNRQVNVVPLTVSKRMISKKIKQDGLYSVGVEACYFKWCDGEVPLERHHLSSCLQEGKVGERAL